MVARGPQRHYGRLRIEGVIDVVYLQDTPLDEIVARRKRFEFSLSFRPPTPCARAIYCSSSAKRMVRMYYFFDRAANCWQVLPGG